ncbi:DUF3078 domain-containing protein [Urechidicola vernalis]|uniref:DUF3078 domain-containing protein n=1 Tax=Urechidicola vernalis TaxID=3075600 RepID=A0ABU2Y8P2_9FLAO|nr:DUF3078 domain-containing protein [Urechidicola sp. P050]MDT0554190.1 DUF3078 domain-containing protein [Urechidicola sp. P050]
MKRLITLILVMGISAIGYSQSDQAIDSLQGWRTSGKISLLINQSAFSNWQAGGDNSFAGNLKVNYNFNYTKDVWSLDNKLLLGYGLTNTEDDGTRKSDDRIELNSILSRAMKKEYWNFSFFMNFKTQFTDGYDYEDDFLDQNPGEDNENYPTSGLFKPAYWQFGPGFLWKKSDRFYVNIAPITSKLTFLTSEIWTYNDDDSSNVFYESSNDVETFGVDPGDNLLYELGMNIRVGYTFTLAKNITVENLIMLYSNYLEDPQNIDIDYTLDIEMKINDWLSTDFTVQTIYDDNSFEGFQVREVFGLGFNLNL